MRLKPLLFPFLFFLFLYLGACASLGKDMDPPKISLDGVESIPGEGGGPRFRMKLRVQNPNQEALDIAGISYEIVVQDVELISGVTNEVPLIEGYSEEPVTLEAGINTLQLIRFFTKLGMGQQTMNQLEYTFRAKIDFNGFTPTQRIEESGVIGGPVNP